MRISLVITHDELIFCVRQKYPNLVHGVDFWVGQNMCRDTGKQLEAARLHVLGQRAREERDRRLMAADAMFYKAMDSGDASKAQQVGQYRQALREVPGQPGFPANFTGPDTPDALFD
ncbi:hypothetical protein P3T32_002552 [Ralstonia sp. GP73]|uniref:phage tail assembly chaperone n=1 Tax=Ralstonia sp. GP101 TaxID=3035146 RepID=UPI00247E2107|nr:hypothetical protein [Ralstonia sp. GP73]